MRVLTALCGNASPRRGEAAGERELAEEARALAAVAFEHELVIAHALGCDPARELELALRNTLPDRDLATVLVDLVVEPGDVDFADSSSGPQAIVELHSLRSLIDAGSLVICAIGAGAPVTVDGGGEMQRVTVPTNPALAAALLARRLDADLFAILSGAAAPDGSQDAARSFVEATGRRAAIGELTKAVEIVRGGSGTQIAAPSA